MSIYPILAWFKRFWPLVQPSSLLHFFLFEKKKKEQEKLDFQSRGYVRQIFELVCRVQGVKKKSELTTMEKRLK
jgi:hypothetical protein